MAFDGGLEEWRYRPHLPLGLVYQTGFDPNWRGRTDLSAAVWFAHSTNSLLLAASVADDKVVIAPGGDPAKGDQLRLYLTAQVADAPAEARAIFIEPGGAKAGPLVVDGDRSEAIPGAVVTWRRTDDGYRVEARIPWAAIPGGYPLPADSRGLYLQVLDWDEAGKQSCALAWPSKVTPPEAPPPAPAPSGWQVPETPSPWRPERLGELRLCDPLEEGQAGPYLAALMPLGTERSYYDGGEEVRAFCLAGLGVPAAARMELVAVDRDGLVNRWSPGSDWTQGAVAGTSWTWRTPYDFEAALLLVGSLGPPDTVEDLVFARLESVGGAYREQLQKLKDLREEMLKAATAPTADATLRRYLGAVLINLEDREQGEAAWRNTAIREDLDQLQKDLAELRDQFAKARAGKDPYAGKKGVFLRGYVSEIDDTVQHYSVGIPDIWAPGKSLPLYINLHGYGFGRFHGHPAPLSTDAVNVACYGRGNGDYKLWCERDIITVLDAMIEDYGIDLDRVYLTGGSMGGTGSYQLATAYPDRFAAIGPTASNTNHHVWEEVWGWGQREPTFLTPFRDWLGSTTSAFQYAENLQHVGVFAVHGEADNICPVGHDRTMTTRLKDLGYDVVYEEHAGVGHGGFPYGTSQRQQSFLAARSRDPYPRKVAYRTSWHRYPGAYWAKMERFSHQAKDSAIAAEIEGQAIRVRTVNLDRFRLELNEHLLDLSRPIEVLVDESEAYRGDVPLGGIVRLGRDGAGWAPAELPGTLEKNPEVGGPVEHAFMSRFLLVQGTTGDKLTNEVNRRMTEQAAEKWRRWGRGQPARVKMDWEVDDQDIADSNLICYGGPDSNAIVKRVNQQLPVRLEPGKVVFGDEEFPGDDVGIKLCYPNPLNQQRYLCVFAGVTWHGTYDLNGRFGNWFDWGIYDDRNWFDFAVFDAHTQSPETFLRVGYFDDDWQLDGAFIIKGDETMRQATMPRNPPDPTAPLPDAQTVYLSELAPRSIVMEKGVLAYDHSFGGRPITLDGMTFERGLGVHPQAELTYDIDRRFQTFEAWVGVDLEGAATVSKAREEAERESFVVYGDGRMLADTGQMRWNSRPKHLVVNVEGVKELRLVTRALDGRKWLFGDSSWGLCRLTAPKPVLPVRPPRRDGADRLSLNGQWYLDRYHVGEGLEVGAENDGTGIPDDQQMTVPGTIAAALMATGELPDLYLNDNLKQASWLGDREWWLYRRFDLPAAWDGRRLTLRVDGLCQWGELWLNGVAVGKVTGPFEAGELDLTAAAECGQSNFLAVRLLAGPAPWSAVGKYQPPGRDSVLGYGVGYGLDGGGTALPLGLTGGVEVRASGELRLSPVRVETQPGEVQISPESAEARTRARLSIFTTVRNDGDEPAEVLLRGRIAALDGEDQPLEFEYPAVVPPQDELPVAIPVDAKAVRLWWPGGMGARPLYRLNLDVVTNDLVSDAVGTDFGVRSVVLETSVTPSVLQVNGYPIVPKMVEWRPIDRFLRGSRERTEHLLRTATERGFNTIRVWAGGGLARPEFYDLCDELGLLVIQDLPLLGDVGKVPEEQLEAAVRGIVGTVLNRPGLIAYGLGRGIADNAAAQSRIDLADDLLAKLDPSHYVIGATSDEPGKAVWDWIDNRTAAQFTRRAYPLQVGQIVLPDAPPASLSFLRRADLTRDLALAPWPLTPWWGSRGGREATFAAAQEWLGMVRHDTDALDLLRWYQAESARRQAADVGGGAVCVSCLNESWPRVGPALIDYAGRARPALDVLQRMVTGPAVYAKPDRQAAHEGETVELAVHAVLEDGWQWWQGRPESFKEVHCWVQDVLGRKYLDQTLPVPAGAKSGLLGTLSWNIDERVPPGSYLVVTQAPGSNLASDLVPLAVEKPTAAPSAKVLWLAAPTIPPPGVELVGRAAFAVGETVSAIYLGPGLSPTLTPPELEQVYRALRGGVGVVVAGPPAWLASSPLVELLPARPAGGAVAVAPEPVPVEVTMASHPALGGLSGRLPDGVPGDYQELADGADVLVRFGPGRPLLVEGSFASARVLMLVTAPDYQRRFRLWDGSDRFLTGLLAYAGKLSFGTTRKLLAEPVEAGLAELRDLAPGPLGLSAATAPLVANVERLATREIQLKNNAGTPMPLVSLWIEGLPTGADVTLSASSCALLPGQTQRFLLTIRYHRRGRWTGKLKVKAAGWGAQPAELELPVELG